MFGNSSRVSASSSVCVQRHAHERAVPAAPARNEGRTAGVHFLLCFSAAALLASSAAAAALTAAVMGSSCAAVYT